MGLAEKSVFMTAHHVERSHRKVGAIRKAELVPGACESTPVLFTACRLSKEKGILELPEIYRRARAQVPDLRMVIAGAGPAEAELRDAMPEATYLGWLSRERMEQVYAALDLFVFPSRFDTFGNVVLEAFSQGMPVLAYDCKGPRDIVIDGDNGYLVATVDDMVAQVVEHFRHPDRHARMRKAALQRAADYDAQTIMPQFMRDLGLMPLPPQLDENLGQQVAA
jgi:glycosyltransferase involved in cell wall biosynthesis